jgi:hydrogenase nickel incorporation protein HypA/HybF
VHELAITQNIFDIALETAKSAQAKKVTRINVVIGELSGIERDCILFYFDFLKKDNIAEEAVIDFKFESAQLKCRDCQAEFKTQEIPWLCPDCHSSSIEIISGRDCFVDSIEVD